MKITKLLVLTCVLTLVLSLFGLNALAVSAAEGESRIVTTEAQLTEAFAAGGHIQLGANITVTANHTIASGKTVVLDLSEYKLDMGSYAITNHGTLELRGETVGEITGTHYKYVIENYGSFTLTSGTVSNSNTGFSAFSAVTNELGGEFIMTGGEVIAVFGIQNLGYATVSGGTVSTISAPYGGCLGINNLGGTLTVSGDTEINAVNRQDVGIYNDNGKVNLMGGRFNATGMEAYNVADRSKGPVADFLVPGYLYYDENGAVITLADGQMTLSGTVTVGECKSHTLINGVCSICKYACTHESVDAATGICNICDRPSALNVIYGTEIEYFNSLADAFARAGEIFSKHGVESIIKLQDNITVSEALTVTGSAATIDLNGKKITFTLTSGICLTLDGTTLTIDDTSAEQTGEVYFNMSADPQNCYCMTLTNSSLLIWEGGVLNGSSGYALLLLDDSQAVQNGGTVNRSICVDKGTYVLNDGLINGSFYSHTDGNSEKYVTNLVLNGGTVSLNMDYIVKRDYLTDFNVTVTGGTFDLNGMIIFDHPSEMKLSGGTFSKGISLTHWDGFTLKDALAPGYLYYDENGNIITLSEGQMEISGKVTVAPCVHDFSGSYLSDSDGHWHECKVCGIIDEKLAHTPEDDDGDCLTAVHCTACGFETTKGQIIHNFSGADLYDESGHWEKCSRCDETAPKFDHSFTVPQKDGTHHWNKCDECDATDTKIAHTFNVPQKDSTDHWNKCSGCDATDAKVKHSGTDDGDCSTEVKCSCGWVLIVAKSHSFDNTCDTDCNNDGCTHTRSTEHTPEADDNDCTTDILCSVCDGVTTKGNEGHTGGTATCTAKAECSVCGTAYGSTLAHTPEADDGDCTTAVKCSVCETVTTPASAAHTGGTATCTAKAKCELCDTEYGTLAEHSYGEDGKCACGAEKPTAGDGETPPPEEPAEEELSFFEWLIKLFTDLCKAIADFFNALFSGLKA